MGKEEGNHGQTKITSSDFWLLIGILARSNLQRMPHVGEAQASDVKGNERQGTASVNAQQQRSGTMDGRLVVEQRCTCRAVAWIDGGGFVEALM